MKHYTYILQYMYIVAVQYYSVIPNRRRIYHVWSCIGRLQSPILTISTSLQVLPYNSQWTKVDDTLPQRTLTLVHSTFANRIKFDSMDVEIYISYVKDPLIKDALHKGKYKGTFHIVYLYTYRTDFRFDWRLWISIQNTSMDISFISLV